MNKSKITSFGWVLAASVLAYYFALRFVFPLHFSTAAHHNDMYATSEGISILTLLAAPRPGQLLVIPFTDLPLEASLAAYAALWVITLAIGLHVFQQYFLKFRLSFSISWLLLVLAFSAPGFYFSHTYDVGTSLAMLFGFLAIWVLEARTTTWHSLLSFTGLCFLSSLSKEGFLPVLLLYALTRPFRFRKFDRTAMFIVAIIIFVAALSFSQKMLLSSPFVRLQGSSLSDPYHVSFSLPSMAAVGRLYLAPLVTTATVMLLLLCVGGAYFRGRILLALGTLLAAFSLYLPYLILPNHILPYYLGLPFPFLMLLIAVPLADGKSGEWRYLSSPIRKYLGIVLNVSVLIMTVVVIFNFKFINNKLFGWFLFQEQLNKNLVTSLRSARTELCRARSMLVFGLEQPFHPWSNPKFITKETGFVGSSCLVLAEGAKPASSYPPSVTSVSIDNITWLDYDVVLEFDPTGRLYATYSREAVTGLLARFSLDSADMASVLRKPELFALLNVDVAPEIEASHWKTIGNEFMKAGRTTAAMHFLSKSLQINEHAPSSHQP